MHADMVTHLAEYIPNADALAVNVPGALHLRAVSTLGITGLLTQGY